MKNISYIEAVNKIIRSVLVDIYTYTGASLLLAVLFMFMYLYIKRAGIIRTVKLWLRNFRQFSEFRRVFLLVFYCAMVVGRTLLCRSIWGNPFSNILGGWGLYDNDGEFTAESIENIILFIPMLFMIICTFNVRLFKGKYKFNIINTIIVSGGIALLCSLVIELCQLFFKLGTSQVADLTYNTLGGIIGGVLYYLIYKIKSERDEK